MSDDNNGIPATWKAIGGICLILLLPVFTLWGAHFESIIWLKYIRPINAALPPVTTLQFALLGTFLSVFRPRIHATDPETTKILLAGLIGPPAGLFLCWAISVVYGWF